MSNAYLILQPFKRLDGTKASGTGLGLAICKRIVERNGGQIWADSEAGVDNPTDVMLLRLTLGQAGTAGRMPTCPESRWRKS